MVYDIQMMPYCMPSHVYFSCSGVDYLPGSSTLTYDVGSIYIFKRKTVTDLFIYSEAYVPDKALSYDNWGRDAAVFGSNFFAVGARYSDLGEAVSPLLISLAHVNIAGSNSGRVVIRYTGGLY